MNVSPSKIFMYYSIYSVVLAPTHAPLGAKILRSHFAAPLSNSCNPATSGALIFTYLFTFFTLWFWRQNFPPFLFGAKISRLFCLAPKFPAFFGIYLSAYFFIFLLCGSGANTWLMGAAILDSHFAHTSALLMQSCYRLSFPIDKNGPFKGL